MSDVSTRIEGRAGRITLTRPKALNALNHDMCLQIEQALIAWRDDAAVDLVLIDAEGERAFCAGGDIAFMYHSGVDGDASAAQAFFRDEYRMNALIATYAKPVVSMMHGFIMGGGVGLGGHASHRILGESSTVSMPECGIGLIPDVGGTHILAQAPGRMGAYLGLTGARLGAADAIYAGFGDYFVPEAEWGALKSALIQGDLAAIEAAHQAQSPAIEADQAEIDSLFQGETLAQIMGDWPQTPSDFAAKARKALDRNSPLSMACTLDLIAHARGGDIRNALRGEFRFTARAIEHGDFLEGVRAAIIDKDRNPSWKHSSWQDLRDEERAALTADLGADELILEE